MSRQFVVVGLLLAALSGCQRVSDAQVAPGWESGTIDYAGWKELTKEPVRIQPAQFAYCRPVPEAAQLGPHWKPEIRLFANEVAAAHLREGRGGSYPVGAIIVKEKWWNDKKDGYAAMIKKEPGYDPEHGDWEYLYVQFGEEEKIERGPIASCINCHAQAAATDYLFGTHLKGNQ